MTKLAIVYHQNLRHSEMSGKNVVDYVMCGLGKIARSVDDLGVPINISGQGLDWKIIETLSPKKIERISKSDYVHILDGFYTHTMPIMFPSQTKNQQDEGAIAITDVFGKYEPFILPPEFDVNSYNIHEFCSIPILNEDVSPFRPKKTTGTAELYANNGSLINIMDSYSGRSRPTVIGISGPVRNAYLGMFREAENNTPQKVAELINDEYAKAEERDCPLIAFATDMEPPWINRVIFDNGFVSDPRLDILESFHKEIKKSGMKISGLDERIQNEIQLYLKDQTPVFLGPRETEKWFSKKESMERYQKILNLKPANTYQHCALHCATVSDTFSAITGVDRGEKSLSTSHNGTPGKVIIKSDPGRIIENDRIVNAIINRVPINSNLNGLDRESKLYLNTVHEIISSAA